MESLPRTADIRQFLFDFFNDEELSTLCFDFFPDVHDNFAAGMTKQQKVIMLLKYCQQQEIVPNLIAALQRVRPEPYAKRFPQAPIADHPPSVENEKVGKLLAEAQSLFEKGIVDDAIRLLKEARSEDPRNSDIEQLYVQVIYAKAVHLYVAEHKLHAARLLLQEVVRLDPSYEDAARLLAEVEQQMQRVLWPRVQDLLRDPIWQRIGATVTILACIVAVVAIPPVQRLLWPAAMPTLTPTSLPPSATPTLTASPTFTLSPSLTPTPTNTPLSPTPTMKPPATLAPGATRVSDEDGMVMVYVPAGEFLMGSADSDSQAHGNEKPQHKVYLDAFWIDRTEVTNAQYNKCVQAGVCKVSDFANDSNYNGDNQPVVAVDWSQAQAYCQWAGRQLPTEAQWEKAARGTDGRVYPWGDQLATCEYAVMNEGSGNGCGARDAPWPVGSKPQGASPYGALDMAGNAWEWVADWLDEGYYATPPPKNPPGPSFGTYRVVRGGSFDNESIDVRGSYRGGDFPVGWDFIRGFRCVLWL